MIVEQLPMFMAPHEIMDLAWPADMGVYMTVREGVRTRPEAWEFINPEKLSDAAWDYDEGYFDGGIREPVHLWRRTRGQRSEHAPNNSHSRYMLTDGHHRLAIALEQGQSYLPVVWVHSEKESSSLWGDEKYEWNDDETDYYERNWLDAALIFRSSKAPKGALTN